MSAPNTFTPGPWFLDKTPNLSGHIKVLARDSETAFEIAYIYSDDRAWRANARAIAALPDVVAALEALATWVDGHGQGTKARMLEEAYAALAKVRGES